VNTEEQQLADMLRRVAPEPPRGVTVEDVAFRLADQAGRSGRRRHREARARRIGWSLGWAPVLAAASVFVVAGASAGVVEVMTSHHAPVSGGSVINPTSAPASTSSSSQRPESTGQPTWPPERIADGPWDAELITPDNFTQDSLVSGPDSLYATTANSLDRIDPVTGNVVTSVSYNSPVSSSYPDRPVVTGNTVWLLSSYSGTSVALTGYDGTTLAQVASIAMPVSGQLSGTPEGVLTSGSDGYLYVAAGTGVAVVNPSTHEVMKRISVPSGPVTSVAVSPDGSKLYVLTGTFDLLTYNPVTGAELASSNMPGLTSVAGNLVATSGGVWGTTGAGMSELAWFAPDADLTRMVRLGVGTGAGLDSIPTSIGGIVWIGGSHTLECASPVTGQVLKTATIPTDGGLVEDFGSVTIADGHAYAYYQDQRARKAGVAILSPPADCSSERT
jgi:hypothetical protein